MIIEPKVRGFICTTAHPEGCAGNIKNQISYVKEQGSITTGPRRVLVIGASTGYGLASRIVSTFGAGASTIGVFFEKAASGKRTASAGWYNSAAFEAQANQAGVYAKSINGDAFSDDIKQQTIDMIKSDWPEGVDLVVYSLASPRRTHPKTGDVFNSTLKPIGDSTTNKTVNVMTGEVSDITLDPANQEDIDNTVAVMGGEDWRMWVDALLEAGVLADGAQTVAYSYVGPELTRAIYREGTIGRAKVDLEKTADALEAQLQKACNGHAFVSVNKGLVTQASAAIPIVPLYFSLMFKVMKEKGLHEGCIEQIYRLFSDKLYAGSAVPVDDERRIRIDEKEMQDDVQAEVFDLWKSVDTGNLESVSDIKGYRHDFYNLFGFEVDGVNYGQDIDPGVGIGSIASE